MPRVPNANQFFVPGWGFVCLPGTSKNDYFVAGFGFVNDSFSAVETHAHGFAG